jgi:hypothetical protein
VPVAELGETSDPVALVPGSPDGVEGVAAVFTARGENFSAVGRDMQVIDLPNWSGDASNRFREVFAPVPTRWYKTADALAAAAGALTAYAETLRWAQTKAGEAVELWEQGEAATATAVAQHQAAVADAGATGQTAPAFHDPGEETRLQARELLDRARTQLDEAGNEAAEAITGHGRQGSDVSTFLSDVLVAVAPAAAPGDGSGGGGGGSWGGGADVTGPRIGASLDDGPGVQPGSVSREFDVFRVPLGADGAIEGGASAEGSASINGSGAHAQGEVTVGITGEYEHTRNYGGAEVTTEAEVLVGGQAEGSVDIGADGARAEGEAFAGARGQLEQSVEVGGVGATGTAEAWFGAGVSGSAGLGYEDGRITIELEGGAALGAGGSLGGEITVDPQEVAETVEEEADIVQRNTDLNPGNDDHQNGILNTIDRGYDAVSGAIGAALPG